MLTHLVRVRYGRPTYIGAAILLIYLIQLLDVPLDSLLLELAVKLLRAYFLKGDSTMRVGG